MSDEQKICGNCFHFGKGSGGVGCGLFNIRPHFHSECAFRPNRWQQRERPQYTMGPPPQEWHLTGQKPKKDEIAFKTKSGKMVKFKKSAKKKGAKKKK